MCVLGRRAPVGGLHLISVGLQPSMTHTFSPTGPGIWGLRRWWSVRLPHAPVCVLWQNVAVSIPPEEGRRLGAHLLWLWCPMCTGADATRCGRAVAPAQLLCSHWTGFRTGGCGQCPTCACHLGISSVSGLSSFCIPVSHQQIPPVGELCSLTELHRHSLYGNSIHEEDTKCPSPV